MPAPPTCTPISTPCRRRSTTCRKRSSVPAAKAWRPSMPRTADMKKSFAALLLAASCLTPDWTASAQPAVDAHLAAAKKAEGTDFPGTIARLCIVPDAPVGGGGGGPRPIPDRATWYAEPARMFDNLYWVGTKIHSAWALQTSGGII